MDTVVIPNMDADYARDRAVDELPQSAPAATIMTTEPKFVPEQGVTNPCRQQQRSMWVVD